METPQCVGFIMDGNRRWAKERGLSPVEGHTKGYEALLSIIEAVHTMRIPHMVCYAFSTENWNRSEEEVSHLMHLLQRGINELRDALTKNDRKANVRIIGDRERLSTEMQKDIARIEAQNVADPELTVWLAISYGGRAEIIAATNRAILKGEPVTEATFAEMLQTHGMPDPDMIIRTSGEQRISNFLLWQSAYSEFFFTNTFWPDFGESEFQDIVKQYGTRQRRKGT